MNVTLTPVTAVVITGTPKVGETLMATLTPAEATGDFQWQRKVDGQGEAQDIEGAIGDSYMIQPEMKAIKSLSSLRQTVCIPERRQAQKQKPYKQQNN